MLGLNLNPDRYYELNKLEKEVKTMQISPTKGPAILLHWNSPLVVGAFFSPVLVFYFHSISYVMPSLGLFLSAVKTFQIIIASLLLYTLDVWDNVDPKRNHRDEMETGERA